MPVVETEQQRYERERLEDEQRYSHCLRTGIGVPSEEVMVWPEKLAQFEVAVLPKARPLGLPYGAADL